MNLTFSLSHYLNKYCNILEECYITGIITETYERPDISDIKEPPELGDLLDTSKLGQKCVPKQTHIDKC